MGSPRYHASVVSLTLLDIISEAVIPAKLVPACLKRGAGIQVSQKSQVGRVTTSTSRNPGCHRGFGKVAVNRGKGGVASDGRISCVDGSDPSSDSYRPGPEGHIGSRLGGLYGVPTKALKQAVKRNIGQFPEDFMFVSTPTGVDR